MNVNNMTLPYPVMGINDDVLPLPSMDNNTLTQTDKNYIFEFDAICTNDEISKLIEDGYADFVCEVGCQRTFLRRCYCQVNPHFVIEIPKDSVSGTIEFELTITVKKPIANYTNKGFHADYMGYSFDLEPGDLLGFIASFVYDADIKYDKLQAVGSFMEINPAEIETTRIDLGGDKISIVLPMDLYQAYDLHVRQDKKITSVIHASLVFNALVQALYQIDEYSGNLWARTIAYRIKTEERFKPFASEEEEGLLDKDKVFDLAQVLLGDPNRRMFTCLDSLTNNVEV